MFNVAVFSLKDLKRYFIKATILVFVIILATHFMSRPIDVTKEQISKYSFLECLNITIPGIKQIDFDMPSNDTSTLERLLNIEFKMASNVTLPDGTNAKVDELSEEEIEELAVKVEIPDKLTTEVIETDIKPKYTNSYGMVQIKNETEFELTEDMLKPNIVFNNSKNILIFHTHTCESYTSSQGYEYQMEGNYRTTNLEYSVARVGSEFSKFLRGEGFSVIHNTTYHDFPAYSGSYDRSLTTVSNLLSENKETEIVFDIHRDSIGDSSYAPTVKIGEEYAAQIMFVIGTNGGGLEHPDWIQNLKTAIKIQEKANEKYPGLFKPIILRNSRYNQNVASGASIIEVGATGNTLDQCINSMKYLSDVLADALFST